MSAAQVLEQARALGIVLSGGGEKLRYEAPAGRLTPELREALAANKAAILGMLEAERLVALRLLSDPFVVEVIRVFGATITAIPSCAEPTLYPYRYHGPYPAVIGPSGSPLRGYHQYEKQNEETP